MAIQTTKPEPSKDLPPAILYLDDLELILSVFRGMHEHFDRWDRAPNGKPELLVFKFDGNLVAESIEDLRKRGGKTSDFQIQYTPPDPMYGRLTLTCGSTNIRWSSYSLPTEAEWIVQGQLEQIFKKRRQRLKILGQKVPWWIISPAWFATIALQFKSWRSAAIIYGLLLTLSSIELYGIFGHTRIYFRPSDSQGFVERHKDKVIVALIAAVTGFAFNIFLQYLIHKWWPSK
jgi:hypothetical protein